MADNAAFGAPYIDVDEWRTSPRRHRYLHGGFEDTHTRFSLYFPPLEDYRGRFVQFLEGGAGGHENLLASGAIEVPELADMLSMDWLFALAFDELGSYLVESNQGHFPGEGVGFNDDIQMYRASAQVARYAKDVAAGVYGEAPHHGYVWGQSGGGVRCFACIENVSDVWDGGVPEVATGLATIPIWSAQALATELLRGDNLHEVVDALEPGGTGDPFAGLDSEQAGALSNLFRFSFSPTTVSQLGRFSSWVFTIEIIKDKDPQYFEDFWTKRGYLGHALPESIRARIVDETVRVTRVMTPEHAIEAGVPMMTLAMSAGASGSVPSEFGAQVDYPDADRLFMAKLRIMSGKAAGREMYIFNVVGDVLTPFAETCPDMFKDVEPGDEVQIDNRDYVAFLYYHRHAIAGAIPELCGPTGVIDEFRHLAINGVPIHPQRDRPASVDDGMQLARRGALKIKAILVMCKQDVCVPHGSATSFDRLVHQELGHRVDDLYRLWWVDNATHVHPVVMTPAISETENDPGVWTSRLVSYDPVTAQALRDIVAWVEDDISPPQSTVYGLNLDNELVLAPTAAERRGVQPVVNVTVAGGRRADVKVGEPIILEGTGDVPPGTGTIVRAQWDFEGTGAFGESSPEANGTSESIKLSTSHIYDKPGTYFPSFRVGSHRQGQDAKGDPIWNLARARVVVHS